MEKEGRITRLYKALTKKSMKQASLRSMQHGYIPREGREAIERLIHRLTVHKIEIEKLILDEKVREQEEQFHAPGLFVPVL